MRYYPVFLDIEAKACVVVGGGAVAERKVAGLLAAGASVTVISPRLTKRLGILAAEGAIIHVRRGYRTGDLEGMFLAVSAASSKDTNRLVYEEASVRGVLINAVDDPPRCNFIVPSMVVRGDLVLAISTSGRSPALAKRLRKKLEKTYGPEYAVFVDILGAVRKKLLKSGADHVKKESVIGALADSGLPALIRGANTREINRLLADIVGRGTTLSKLGVDLHAAG